MGTLAAGLHPVRQKYALTVDLVSDASGFELVVGAARVGPRRPATSSAHDRGEPSGRRRTIGAVKDLEPGLIVTGAVVGISPTWLTFVDVGGVRAHINIPELSWRPFSHPTDVVSIGQEIAAEVLDIDDERGRVALSLKALRPDPMRDLRENTTVTGPVVHLAPIGVFVRIEDRPDGFLGLLRDTGPEVGDVVTATIAKIDLVRRTIELSRA